MPNTKITNWKSLLPILIPAILSSGFILTGISTFFNETFNKPNLQIDINQNQQNKSETDITIKNNGKVTATNITMIVVSQHIIDSYNNFTTENIRIEKINDNILNVTIPKIVQGGGSLVSIKLNTTDTVMPDIHEKYGIFVVYDQGSIYKSFRGYILSISEQFQEFWTIIYSDPFYMIIIGIIVIALSIIYLKFLKRLKIRRILDHIYYHRLDISTSLHRGIPINLEEKRERFDYYLERLRLMKMKKEEID